MEGMREHEDQEYIRGLIFTCIGRGQRLGPQAGQMGQGTTGAVQAVQCAPLAWYMVPCTRPESEVRATGGEAGGVV